MDYLYTIGNYEKMNKKEFIYCYLCTDTRLRHYIIHGHCYMDNRSYYFMCQYHRYILVFWTLLVYIDTCYTEYYYFMYLYHDYFHVFVSSFHGHSTHCMYLSHGFICILALIVHVFLLHKLLLHGYSCILEILLHDCFLLLILIYIVTGHVSY